MAGAGGKAVKGRWFLVLFSLPFTAAGVGMLVMAVLPTLADWHAMRGWVPVDAEVLSAELEQHNDGDGSTYRAVASYRYEFRGTGYTGTRVAINDGGADNIGDFQQQRASELMQAFRDGRAVTVYVDPEDPAQSVYHRGLRALLLAMYTLFALLFGGAGIGLMVYALRARAGDTDAGDAARPWLARPEWQSPAIVARPKAGVVLLWVIALAWCGISALPTLVIADELAKGNSGILVVLLFDAIGLGLLVAAVHQTLAWRRFGDSTLHMDPHPGGTGGEVGGWFDVRLPYSATQVFDVTLTCLHTYVSGSGKNRSTRNDALWQDRRLLRGEPAPDGNTRVWFHFRPPAGLPVSQAPDDDYHHWQLAARAELAGVDFSREWPLPVFAVPAASREAARRVQEARDAQMARLDGLLNLEQVAGGIRLRQAGGRHWGSGLAAFVFGSVFAAVPVMMWYSDAGFMTFIFGPVFGGVGLLVMAAGVWMAGNGLAVTLGDEGLHQQRFLFGLRVRDTRVPREALTGLGIRRGGSSQAGNSVSVSYDLVACTADGTQHLLADGLDGAGSAQQAAEAVAAWTRLPLLGEVEGAKGWRRPPRGDRT